MAGKPRPLAERLWKKVDRRGPDECWPWLGKVNEHGYGRISSGGAAGRMILRAHRVAYELLIGPIPDGLVIDHLCRNPGCCNPAHMEPVTQGTNALRGMSPPAVNSLKTHCPQGHPYAGRNLYRARGHRQCRACGRAKYHARKQSEGSNG